MKKKYRNPTAIPAKTRNSSGEIKNKKYKRISNKRQKQNEEIDKEIFSDCD
jgi:hypothetical protein